MPGTSRTIIHFSLPANVGKQKRKDFKLKIIHKNMEKYQEAIGLAADCREYVLEGGNHAGFGNYGSQKGDGEAGITDREQWQETIDYIMDMIRQQQGEK